MKPKKKKNIGSGRKMKCTDLSAVPEVFDESIVEDSKRSKKEGLNVLIAEDTYVHMALLGYILSSEIPAEKLDIKLTNDGGQTFTVLMESITNHCLMKESCGSGSSSSFDLLILDFSMPVMDGLKIAKIFRMACQINEITPPPMILLTSYDKDYFDPIEFIGNAIIYMKKPVNVDELKETF
jgi:CheY-like chemotaxis protein